MNAKRVLQKFEKTYEAWRAALARNDDDRFARPLGAGAWNLGQVCEHVAGASEVFLERARAVANGEGEPARRKFAGVVLSMLGSFPPTKIKVPKNLPPELEAIKSPQGISRQEAIERFARIEAETRELCAPVEASPRNRRTNHPVAGPLNAREWYQFSEMHMRHHLRQLGRVEQQLAAP